MSRTDDIKAVLSDNIRYWMGLTESAKNAAQRLNLSLPPAADPHNTVLYSFTLNGEKVYRAIMDGAEEVINKDDGWKARKIIGDYETAIANQNKSR